MWPHFHCAMTSIWAKIHLPAGFGGASCLLFDGGLITDGGLLWRPKQQREHKIGAQLQNNQ
jgi:hypothetical protein